MNNSSYQKLMAERRAKVRAHYAASKSLAKTAEKFGVTPQRVHAIVKAAK